MNRASAMTRFAPTAAAAAACFGSAMLGAAPSGVAAATRIATPDGAIAAADLRPAATVLTALGTPARVVTVVRRVLAAETLRHDADGRPVCLAVNAIADGIPARPLLVGPEQLLLIDGEALPAAALVNGVSITRASADGAVTYMRIRLDAPGAFLAEGTACAGAGQPPAAAASLAETRKMLEARIGLERGKLVGNVASADHAGATGWTIDEAHPEAPVAVEFVARGEVVAHALADLRRPDLTMAGIGNGRCGFVVRPNRKLPPSRDHLLQVRRVGDGADVPGSPLLLPRATGTPADLNAAMAQALATPATRDDLAAFLAGQLDRLLDARANRPPAAT
jgi:hypothetical protein